MLMLCINAVLTNRLSEIGNRPLIYKIDCTADQPSVFNAADDEPEGAAVEAYRSPAFL